jgi:predicted DsbA family dithiol-disulfide isomerase
LDGLVKVEIWSDVVCPWCYIGKRRFEAALSRFEHRDEVEVVWRAFELDPRAPAQRDRDYAGHLAAKYGVSVGQGQAMIDRMTATAAEEGLSFRFDIARPGNTFHAHRLTHLAADGGLQDAMVERLFAATFAEGEPIGDPEALVRLAAHAGLDPDEARAVLASDAYADDVRAEEREAAALGIRAVPFFVIDRTYGVSGAQQPEVLLEVLEKAWAESRPPALQLAGAAEAPGCDDEGCAV